MYEYQISRVLDVFDGYSFEGIIDLGMGVYLKKVIYLSGICSPSINNEEQKDYGIQARNKLKYYLRNATKGEVTICVDDYHDDTVYGIVYNKDFDDSVNWIMFLKGYVWDDGISRPRLADQPMELFVLNTPKDKLFK